MNRFSRNCDQMSGTHWLVGTEIKDALLDRSQLSDIDGPPERQVLLSEVADANQGHRLDCIGYFRKQDLTLWWPVNIAELRSIQKRVLDLGTDQPMRAGHLVTIAAEAVHVDVMPKLSGTTVDRSVDLRPDDLMKMA